MPSDPSVLEYDTTGRHVPVKRRVRDMSAGEVATKICVTGLLTLVMAAVTGFFGLGLLSVPLCMLAGLAWLVGVLLSIAGVFEADQVRSHVGMGCSMAVLFTLAWPAIFFTPLVVTFVKHWHW